MTPLEKEFHRETVLIYERAKAQAGYTATDFLQMVSEMGGLAAARQLVMSAKPSDGFTALWDKHRLDLTVEALVLEERFAELFGDDFRETALARLTEYGWPGRVGGVRD